MEFGFVMNYLTKVRCAYCVLCAKHRERLRSFRNFSDAFVNGITGSALKRDALPFKMGAGK